MRGESRSCRPPIGEGLGEHVRAQLMAGDAGQARNGGDMLGRNAPPFVRSRPAQTKVACQSRIAAGRFDRSLNASPKTRFEIDVGHKGFVEKFSTADKLEACDPLNSQEARNSTHCLPMTDAHHKRDVGDRLRQAREALGFGLREFARLHDLDPTKLSHWEKGKHYPDPQFIRELWRRHRVNADWVYLGEIASLPHSLVESLRAAERGSQGASSAASAPLPEKT